MLVLLKANEKLVIKSYRVLPLEDNKKHHKLRYSNLKMKVCLKEKVKSVWKHGIWTNICCEGKNEMLAHTASNHKQLRK